LLPESREIGDCAGPGRWLIKKAVLQLSGGLDSTTALAMVSASDYEFYALANFLATLFGQHYEVWVTSKLPGFCGQRCQS